VEKQCVEGIAAEEVEGEEEEKDVVLA